MSRKGKKKGRPASSGKRSPANSGGQPQQGSSRASVVAGAVALAASVGAFVFGVLSYSNDLVVAKRDSSSEVDFVIVRPDVKKNIPMQDSDDGTLDGGSAAIDVVLNNKGGQTAIIHKIDVTVKDYARLDSCTGAGGLPVSASFDFQIPTTGAIKGQTFSKEDLFTVEGQKPDRMRVAIGPDQLSEGTWSWIYVVSVTVHVKSTADGEPDQEVETPDVIVVDDRVAGRYDQRSLDIQSLYWKDCVREHEALVDRMINRPEKHSAALDELHRAIAKLDL